MSYLGCARPPPRPLCRGTNCSPPLRRAPLPGCLLLPLCLLRLVNTPSSWRCRSDVVQVSSPLGSLPLMPQPHPDPSPPGTTGFTQQLTNCENPRTASSTDPELGGPGQWERGPALSPQSPLCLNVRVACLDRVSRSPVSSRGGTRAPGPQTCICIQGGGYRAPLASHAQPTGAGRM